MKKTLTIGGTVLGFLLISALVISVFFPGLPTYLKVKHRYDHIDDLVPEFEKSEVPSDFASHSLKGVSFRIPADWEGSSPIKGGEASSYKSGKEYRIFVLTADYKELAKLDEEYKNMLSDQYDKSDLYDPWEYYKFKEADYRHFYKTIGVDLPQYGLSSTMVFYTRNCLTAKKCLKLRGKDKDVFLDLAQTKEEAVGIEKMWKTKISGFNTYIGQEVSPGYNGNLWVATIFSDNTPDKVYTVTLNCPDETMAKQIISSVELE
ncbi:MAG: hypothetical protein K6G33_06825 [Ruminococcus sp.]|uniref:hypothetical protein n=1 Tax=Ruminococcus sp. TaxID=41978 RepID=UPI0025D78893|nr:hypothetical protein [Ruminococcus sp.]MCR5600433.1 hypothetical protein [Ruminococcus sp.]